MNDKLTLDDILLPEVGQRMVHISIGWICVSLTLIALKGAHVKESLARVLFVLKRLVLDDVSRLAWLQKIDVEENWLCLVGLKRHQRVLI